MAQQVTRSLSDNRPSPEPIPPLKPGDRLTRPEFERRYDAMPLQPRIDAEQFRDIAAPPQPRPVMFGSVCAEKEDILWAEGRDLCGASSSDIPNRKHLIPSRSLATSEAYTLYLSTTISILQQSRNITIAGPAKKPDRNRKVKIQNAVGDL
jgi:hypothetical protein